MVVMVNEWSEAKKLMFDPSVAYVTLFLWKEMHLFVKGDLFCDDADYWNLNKFPSCFHRHSERALPQHFHEWNPVPYKEAIMRPLTPDSTSQWSIFWTATAVCVPLLLACFCDLALASVLFSAHFDANTLKICMFVYAVLYVCALEYME